jgi:hypothetical protein
MRDLVARLCAEAAGLLNDALRLLGAEARGRLSELTPALLLLAAAAGTLLVALTAAGAAIVAALVSVMPLWGAALAVAAAALSVAVGFGVLGSRRLRGIARPPEQTLNALEEGIEWLRLRSPTPPPAP